MNRLRCPVQFYRNFVLAQYRAHRHIFDRAIAHGVFEYGEFFLAGQQYDQTFRIEQTVQSQRQALGIGPGHVALLGNYGGGKLVAVVG